MVRASKPLTDRSDISVGPVRVEVVEPLRKLRVIVEPDRPADSQLAMDVTWTSPIDPFEEPRQYLRTRGTLVFNTQRFAQLGRWEGTLTVDGTDIAVTRSVAAGPGTGRGACARWARSSPTASARPFRCWGACGTTCPPTTATTG